MMKPHPIVAVNLETLERFRFPSFAKAAIATGTTVATVTKCYHDDAQHNGWYYCDNDQLEATAVRIRQLSAKWKREGMPIRPYRRKAEPNADSLVSLRIDSHTVILVPPEKATEEYARQWRERHDNSL